MEQCVCNGFPPISVFPIKTQPKVSTFTKLNFRKITYSAFKKYLLQHGTMGIHPHVFQAFLQVLISTLLSSSAPSLFCVHKQYNSLNTLCKLLALSGYVCYVQGNFVPQKTFNFLGENV